MRVLKSPTAVCHRKYMGSQTFQLLQHLCSKTCNELTDNDDINTTVDNHESEVSYVGT